LINKISNLKSNASQRDYEDDFLWKNAPQARFFDERKCAAGKTYQIKCAVGQIFY